MCSRLYFYFLRISPDFTILFLFSGEWCLKAKIYMLGVLTDTSRLLFLSPLSERVTELTYVFTYTHKHIPFWIDLSIENILSSHRYLHFQPNISGFTLAFSFSLFLTTFSVRTLVSIFLSGFTYFSKTPVYITKSPLPSLVCVFFSHSTWKHSTPAAFLCGLPCLGSDISGHWLLPYTTTFTRNEHLPCIRTELFRNELAKKRKSEACSLKLLFYD